jgi:hypothetical protein
MYVDESVLNFMNSEHAESAIFKNELMEGTVLFIDICGFTSISESRPPNEVVNMLNTYFDIMADEIIKEDGIIDKFIGDAIMATFRGEFHTDRAIDASLAIMRKFTSEHVGDINDGFKPKISIGINSGEMFWGNIGSPKIKRLDYTVIGDAVNIASRIQSAAKPGQILIMDMGKQVKILDLAKEIIANSGKDIKIKNIGMRAGETLSEKLMTEEEEARAIKKDNFFIIN